MSGVTPTPSLTYHWWGTDAPSGEGIVGDGPTLFRVFEVSAWPHPRDGAVEVWARGRVLRRDGTPGRAQRSRSVDLTHDQPDWLRDVITDACARLTPAARRDERDAAFMREASQ